MTLLDNFDAHLYSAQAAPDRDAQLDRLTVAVEALGNVVRVLDTRLNNLEALAGAQAAGADPLRLLDLSEFARRAGFARATVGKMRAQLPLIYLPSGKGELPFIREVDAIAWLEAHKRPAQS